MGVLIIHHKVADFATWKPVYDGHDAIRNSAGLTKGHVFRGVDDPNMVTIVLEFADRAKADAFSRSENLKNAMKAAGVTGKPEILLMTRAD
jgi:heme-degrading monooxygenase HmoA